MTMGTFTAPSVAPARWTALSIVGLAGVLVLAGCGSSAGSGTPTASTGSPDPQVKLFSDDFEGVCQGATVSKATQYVPTGAAHKVILFSPNDGKLYEDTSTLPTDWMVQFDTKSDAYAKVDTVACVDVTSQQTVKECTGYTHDDHETNDKVTLNTATYTVTVREATTGKVLGTTELDGTDDTCPPVMTFDTDDQTKIYDAPPSTDDLIAFMKPFVQP